MDSVDSTLQTIVAILSRNVDFRPRIALARITPDTRFREDLGFDSIALMSLAFELQEIYPTLDEMAIATWTTVGDCVRAVGGLV